MRAERVRLILFALLFGCRSVATEPESSPAPPPPPLASARVLTELPAGQPGDWMESRHYRLRVLDVIPCNEPASDPARAPYRLGVAIEIQATDDVPGNYVFASPRAAELEKNGAIFSALLEPTPTSTCPTPLRPRTLGPGQAATGILVFEAPNPGYLRGATLRFKPPRWGHEARLAVLLPET
ncbi:MAG TPA: hypothetical protein VGK73_11485 [Polyangiaceae bacterium]